VSVAPECTSGTNLCCDIGVDILYLTSDSSQRFVDLVRSSGEPGAGLLLFANDHAPSRTFTPHASPRVTRQGRSLFRTDCRTTFYMDRLSSLRRPPINNVIVPFTTHTRPIRLHRFLKCERIDFFFIVWKNSCGAKCTFLGFQVVPTAGSVTSYSAVISLETGREVGLV
jgi:hypothetical protein